MRKASRLLNKSEEVVFRELNSIANDNQLRAFTKVRLSDVIDKGTTHLSKREFDYLTRSHFDFVLTDADSKPVMAIEYDGPHHADISQVERDKIKNSLCKQSQLGLLRISDRHVSRLYRGMTLLRWIVEVTELSDWFYKAQMSGQVPVDEPFSPFLLDGFGGERRFPYWLSANATQQINSFMRKQSRDQLHGWGNVLGSEDNGTSHSLNYMFFEGFVLASKTAVRSQDLEDFPQYDLLDEVGLCELGIKLSEYRSGKIAPMTYQDFRNVYQGFCEKYDAHPAHSSGGLPFDANWNFNTGWSF